MEFTLTATAALKQPGIIHFQCKLPISGDKSNRDCWQCEKDEMSLNANEQSRHVATTTNGRAQRHTTPFI